MAQAGGASAALHIAAGLPPRLAGLLVNASGPWPHIDNVLSVLGQTTTTLAGARTNLKTAVVQATSAARLLPSCPGHRGRLRATLCPVHVVNLQRPNFATGEDLQ